MSEHGMSNRVSAAIKSFLTETTGAAFHSQPTEAGDSNVSNGILLKSLNSLISKLQAIVEDIRHDLLVDSTSLTEERIDNEMVDNSFSSGSKPEKNGIGNDRMDLSLTEDRESEENTSSTSPYFVDPSLIQIKASNSEIQRRISALIEQKRTEVDENNKREFCSPLYSSSDTASSCARTDANVIARLSGKSHIKVSRVVNIHGPQTHIPPSPTKPLPNIKTEDDGIVERLENMEKHLHINDYSPDRKTLFSRLKVLEERLLYLEGLSPEYFQQMPFPRKRHKPKHNSERYCKEKDMSITEMDERIESLKQMLQDRSTML